MSLPTAKFVPSNPLLTQVASAAYYAELRTGFPAPITVSQWAIESAWGASAAPGHNYFGIKYASRHYSYYWSPTTEFYNSTKDLDYALSSLSIKDPIMISKPGQLPIEIKCQAKFAAYPSLQSSIDDYIYLMTMSGGPYAKAFQTYLSSPKSSQDLNTLGLSIASIYATAPSYGKLLTTLMSQSNVISAINLAKLAATPPASALPQSHSYPNPLASPNPEPTTTLTSLLNLLSNGSSLSYSQPHFYLTLPGGPPTQISAWDIGFRPMVNLETGGCAPNNP